MSTSPHQQTPIAVQIVQRPALGAPPLGKRPEFTPPTELLALARARASRPIA